MKSSLVSIIIPFYNTKKEYMDRCINSVLGQTYENFECIIVDDGSKSEYADLLSDYEMQDKRIRVYHKNNGGLGNTRNHGVTMATGEYVFFLDSDDYISPFALENGVDIVSRTKADMVVGCLKHINESITINFKRREDDVIILKNKSDKQDYINHISGYKNRRFITTNGNIGPSACARLISRKLMQNVHFENDKFWDEDNLWCISIIAQCKTVAIADSLWYAYVINPGSMLRGYQGSRTYEFQFRARQEYERIKETWPQCMQAAYHSVWNGFLNYCRTDVFNKYNEKTEKQKYQDYKETINLDEFKEMSQNIDFSFEQRYIYRLIKTIIRDLLRLKNKRFSYLALRICEYKIVF